MHVHSPDVVVTSAAPASLLTNVHLSPSTVRLLSASHVIIAFVVIILQIIATSIAETHSDSNSVDRIYSSSSTGAGIWCGVFFAGTGIVGWMTARKKSNCYLISFLTLSVVCVVPFCTLECAAASHDLAERYYLFCNHRFSSTPPAGGALVVPCSRHYDVMVYLNVFLLVFAALEATVAVASVVVASKALHQGRGCVCCCGGCYGVEASSATLTPPPQSFVIYTRGNLVAADHSPAVSSAAPSSAPHTVLALSPNGVHPQYFSFHAPDVSEAQIDFTGARYTANGTALGSDSTEAPANDSVDTERRLVCSRSPPPSYEESLKR